MLPFHISCKTGNGDILELFIKRMDSQKLTGLMLTDSGLSPLHTICRNKSEKYSIIKMILEKLIMSDTSQDREVFDQVLNKEDSNKQTILHIAIENNHANIVELLFRDYNFNR